MTELPMLKWLNAKPASGGAAKQLFLFLHGLGANGNDLITLAHDFAQEFHDAAFLSPHAPFECDMAPGMHMSYQWFSMADRSVDALSQGVREAEPIVNKFIDDQLMIHGLDDSKLVVVGFSQGTMLALHTMLRRPKPCAAVIGFSGALVDGGALSEEIQSRPPVCLIHCDMDDVVPHAALGLADEILEEVGVPHEVHTIPNLAHGIDQQGLYQATQFLKKQL